MTMTRDTTELSHFTDVVLGSPTSQSASYLSPEVVVRFGHLERASYGSTIGQPRCHRPRRQASNSAAVGPATTIRGAHYHHHHHRARHRPAPRPTVLFHRGAPSGF